MNKLFLVIILSALSGGPAAAMDRDFQVLARLTQGPGNVTVTTSGRIVVSQHQFYEPRFSVV